VATKADHFQRLIVEPTLAKMGEYDPKLNTPASVVLVMGTAAQETNLGYYWVQNTPQEVGKGFFQIEKDTLDYLLDYLDRPSKHGLRDIIMGLVSVENSYRGREVLLDELVESPKFSTAMCRLRYWPIPAPVPPADDLLALGAYWKKWYNTIHGAGTAEAWVSSYKRFVKGD